MGLRNPGAVTSCDIHVLSESSGSNHAGQLVAVTHLYAGSWVVACFHAGASIRTVSGIRGTIKKAIKQGGIQGAKDGCFR